MPACGNKVPIRGVASVIKIIVAGTSSKEAYFTEEAKTVLTNSGSLSALSLENAGNKAVATGIEMKVKRTEK